MMKQASPPQFLLLLLLILGSLGPSGLALGSNNAEASRDAIAADAVDPVELPEIKPNDTMRRETLMVVRWIQSAHFSKKSISDLDHVEFLNRYMEELDYNHLYFLADDAEFFKLRFGKNLEMWLREGNLHPAFEIFRTFRDNAVERLAWIEKRLGEDFNFSRDRVYVPDRGDAAWPESREKADQFWEKRLKFELLGEILAKISDRRGASSDASEAEAASDSYEIDEAFLESEAFAEMLDEAREDVRRRYQRFESSLLELEPSYVQETFLTTLTSMFDPHSNFLAADSLEEFSMSIQNSFVGIGAVLQDKDGYCTIQELLPGGPADLSGELGPEDVILGVGQGEDGEVVDVVDMNLRKIVKKIKGEKGTTVRLQINPADAPEGAREIVTLVRDEIKLTANLASAEVYQVPLAEQTVPVGVIQLPSFYGGEEKGINSTTTDVEELIGKLKAMNVRGLVLDLRRNGGGLLNEAIDLAGLFIEKGPVVQVKDLRGNVYERFDRDPKVSWSGPLVVLTSRYSASASEIVAGALQDHKRAVIVGDSSTHGKGTVQAIYEMDRRPRFPDVSNDRKMGAAKITIQKFYLPSGASTQERGVRSDIVLPSVNEFLPIGESDLEYALGWDTIDPLPWDYDAGRGYDPVDAELLAFLREQSRERQTSLVEFDYLKESIDWFRERRERNAFSLNLLDRREQLRVDEAFQETMDERIEELAQRTFASDEVLLDLTLEQEQISAEAHENNGDSGDVASSKVEGVEEGLDDLDGDDRPELDIHLHETLRIMGDWIARSTGREPADFMRRGEESEEPGIEETVTTAEASPRPEQPL